MKDLEFTCNAMAADTAKFIPINEIGIVEINIQRWKKPVAAVQINKQKAAQLRDWLNEFLGESNLNLAAPDMYDMLASIENDDNQVPAFLWDKIQATLAKARGES